MNYNDENSLSCVLTMAYFTAPGYYEIVREHPAGKGYANFIFKPRANVGWRPAMVVELKYNQSADTAIKQIKEKRYQGALLGYSDKILLVGINYDAEGKEKTSYLHYRGMERISIATLHYDCKMLRVSPYRAVWEKTHCMEILSPLL